MEPSKDSAPPARKAATAAWLDRAALAGLVLGFVLYMLPAEGALKAGFWVTLFFTVAHIFTSHMNKPSES